MDGGEFLQTSHAPETPYRAPATKAFFCLGAEAAPDRDGWQATRLRIVVTCDNLFEQIGVF